MTEREILDRIIGIDSTLDDVAAAFTDFLHPSLRFEWRSSVRLTGEAIAIDGKVFLRESEVAHFAPRLYYQRGRACADHQIFEVERKSRNKGIAFASYVACIRFYERVGITQIHLKAESMGIFVWPAFGFDFAKLAHKQRLLSLLKKKDVSHLPPIGSLFAPAVVDIGLTDDPPFGLTVLAELGTLLAETGEFIPMILNLESQEQRTFLESSSILDE